MGYRGYGLPMAVVLLKPELDQWQPGEHNGTFRGNNHAFVTATKALESYWADDAFEQHIATCAKQVSRSLALVLCRYPNLFEQLKGRGMMQGIACKSGEIASQIAEICFEQGLVIETAGPEDEVVKFFAPLTITASELDQGLSIFAKAAEITSTKLTKKVS
jgi:diaminobutyrate-2-oxoglutarate transaminase